MSANRLGTKPLRLLICMVMFAMILCGCSSTKYEPVESYTLAENRAAAAETGAAAFTIGETSADSSVQMLDEVDSSAETMQETETYSYQEVDEWVVVTADALNVRKTDSTDAKIYVQLHKGDLLERTGFHEEWSRVLYEGQEAYVASDMVEVTEVPQETVMAEGSDIENSDIENTEISAETEVQGAGNREMEVQAAEVPKNGHVVAVDAGHQAKANAEKEPIGPGSTTMKAKMEEGAVGTVSGVKEYELTLTMAQKLEAELQARGYEVVMIRTGHDVNLSNAERSIRANESDAEILLRLHANSMENSSIYGALTMCMTEYNPYNAKLYGNSYNLSKKIIDQVCAQTGTKNRGVQTVDNSSAINWCEIPVSVLEMGFLSNPDEDRWLQNEEYQGKMVKGIADAIDSYFAGN